MSKLNNPAAVVAALRITVFAVLVTAIACAIVDAVLNGHLA